MIHVFDSEWRYKELTRGSIPMQPVFSYIKAKQLDAETIDIAEIGSKYIDKVSENSIRYINADTSYPVILVKYMENPEGKKYRMIDGRHRLKKLMSLGKTSVQSYVLSETEIQPFIVL